MLEDHDCVVAGHAVGDARGEARLPLIADAVDQDAGAFAVTKRAQDALGLAPAADKLGRRRDRHAPLPEVEKFLVAGVMAESAAGPVRRAQRAAALRSDIGSRQMPMPPVIGIGQMGAQQRPPGARRGIRDRTSGCQFPVKDLGKADRVGVIDRSVPADRIRDTRADQRLDKGGRRGAMLAGAAGRQEHQCRLLALLAERRGEPGNPGAGAAPFGLFEQQEGAVLVDVAVTGEVQRPERPVLRDALDQEFDGTALFDIEGEIERFGRLQDRTFLLLVVQDALAFDLGSHEQQRQIAIGRCRGRARSAETPGNTEQPLLVLGEESPVPCQQFPGHVEQQPFALFRPSRHRDVERDFPGAAIENPVKPMVALVEEGRDVLPDLDQRRLGMRAHRRIVALGPAA